MQPSRQPAATEGEWTLEAIRKLINTNNIDEGTDELSTAGDFGKWLVGQGLAIGHPANPESELGFIIGIREGLRALAMMNNGIIPDELALRRLGEMATKLNFRLTVSNDGLLRFAPEGEGIVKIAGSALLAAYRSMIDGSWFRLKACKNDSCLWAFYDHSRNHSGKWCSMSECGNKMKSRRYLARSQSQATPVAPALSRRAGRRA